MIYCLNELIKKYENLIYFFYIFSLQTNSKHPRRVISLFIKITQQFEIFLMFSLGLFDD